MAKRHVLVGTTTLKPKKARLADSTSIDWELCVLCQEETGAAMQYPTKSTREPVGNGYKSLAYHLVEFAKLGNMPLDISMLNDGDGIEATLTRHHAGWHKSCRLKFNQTKLERLQRKSIQEVKLPLPTRSSSFEAVDLTEVNCFFCDKPAGSEKLFNAATQSIDERVRDCATQLGDTTLLAKLAARSR